MSESVRKHAAFVGLALFLAGLCLSGWLLYSSRGGDEPIRMFVKRTANSRDKPTSSGSSVLAVLTPGTKIEGLWVAGSARKQERWMQINIAGQNAYVWSENLSLSMPSLRKAISNQPPILTMDWLIGWWDDEGFCAGDSGTYFAEDGSWDDYGYAGTWELQNTTLRLITTTADDDTVSGQVEPVKPPRVIIGKIMNAEADSYSFEVRSKVKIMRRCQDEF